MKHEILLELLTNAALVLRRQGCETLANGCIEARSQLAVIGQEEKFRTVTHANLQAKVNAAIAVACELDENVVRSKAV